MARRPLGQKENGNAAEAARRSVEALGTSLARATQSAPALALALSGLFGVACQGGSDGGASEDALEGTAHEQPVEGGVPSNAGDSGAAWDLSSCLEEAEQLECKLGAPRVAAVNEACTETRVAQTLASPLAGSFPDCSTPTWGGGAVSEATVVNGALIAGLQQLYCPPLVSSQTRPDCVFLRGVYRTTGATGWELLSEDEGRVVMTRLGSDALWVNADYESSPEDLARGTTIPGPWLVGQPVRMAREGSPGASVAGAGHEGYYALAMASAGGALFSLMALPSSTGLIGETTLTRRDVLDDGMLGDPTVIHSFPSTSGSLAGSASHLAWYEHASDRLVVSSVTECAVAKVRFPATTAIGDLAVNATKAFFGYGPEGLEGPRALCEIDLDTRTASSLIETPPGDRLCHVRATDSLLVWVQGGPSACSELWYLKLTESGAKPRRVVCDDDHVTALAVDERAIYWFTNEDMLSPCGVTGGDLKYVPTSAL